MKSILRFPRQKGR
ncbi:hypothetical protein RDABS01_015673 [Bienertia sinuspersici]